MISGNSDQGGCALRASKRSEPCADSSASSVISSAPALSMNCRKFSSNPWQICVSKPSVSSATAMASASWPTGAMMITCSSLCIRDMPACLSRVASFINGSATGAWELKSLRDRIVAFSDSSPFLFHRHGKWAHRSVPLEIVLTAHRQRCLCPKPI